MYKILRRYNIILTMIKVEEEEVEEVEEEKEKPKITNNKEDNIFRFFLEYQQSKNNKDVEMNTP